VRISDGLRNGRSELRIEFVTDLAQLEALAGPWETLNARLADHDAPFFQSFAWSIHVARVRSSRSADRYRVCVAKVLRGARLVGLWPLSLQRHGRAWLARSLDDPFGQFAGTVFHDRDDIVPGVLAVVAALRRARLADGVQIEGVIAGTPLHQGLAAAGLRATGSTDAVVVDLRSFASFEDYTRTVNAKTRKNLRNLLNRLARSGPVTAVAVTESAPVRELIEMSFADRVQWLNARGKSSSAFRDGDFHALVKTLPGAPGITLRAFAMVHGGNVIARQWGFVDGGRYYAYISSRDPVFDAFSAGRIHLGCVIQSCYENGLSVLELMPPKVDYKLTWTDKTKRVDQLTASFTAHGRLVLDLWLMRLDPALRKLSHRLPRGVRRRLAELVNGAG
jgi:CelD/BcsL family acetyltransferase involved in cellulose biosynthesis